MSELIKTWDLNKDFKMINDDEELGLTSFTLTEILCCIREARDIATSLSLSKIGAEDVAVLIEKAFIFNLGVIQGKKKESEDEL